MKICPRCGGQNPDGNHFCNFCGQPLPTEQQKAPGMQTPSHPVTKTGMSRTGLILLLAVGFIIVALITAIVVILIRTGGSHKPSESSRPSSHAARDRDEEENEDEDEEEEEKTSQSSRKDETSPKQEEPKKAKKTYVIEIASDVETTRYFYDMLGRTERIEYAGMPDGYTEEWITYQYGALGKLSRRDESDGSYKEYDLDGREILSVDKYGAVTETTYDENGNVIDLLEPSLHHYMEYDEQNRPIKETVNSRLADGQETLKEIGTYEYSEDGLYKALTTYVTETDVTRLTAEWRYDTAGNEIYYHLYSRSGENDVIREAEYDNDGNILWLQYLAVDGTVTKREDYIYDEHGYLIEKYSSDLFEQMTETYERDENGQELLVTKREVRPDSEDPIDVTYVTDLYELNDHGDVRYHYEYTVGVDINNGNMTFYDEYLEKGKDHFLRLTIYIYDYETIDPYSLIQERSYD